MIFRLLCSVPSSSLYLFFGTVSGESLTFEQDRADVGLLALLQSLLCGKWLGLDARRFQLVDEILLAFRVEQEINPPSG
jgi:hypothetical protein